jgi:hypothetical protein
MLEEHGHVLDLAGVEAHVEYHPHRYGQPKVLGIDGVEQADFVMCSEVVHETSLVGEGMAT